jgi:ubiquitin-conjugating enzyme E2 S
VQTIKCLLIDPNPESALNEEAGKLLLEAYDEYAKHARLWTTIHAQKEVASLKTAAKDVSSTSTTTTMPVGSANRAAGAAKPAAAKKATGTAASAKKKTEGEQKKKSIKRL